jgi:glucosyl-dolichyl phosphate glucuronosyltransferase
MTQTSFISVIVPTCFREEMVTACIDSLLNQTYTKFEIIVIDQMEDSRLDAILKRRFDGDSKIRYIHAVSAGAARARNMGLANATGSVVAFIDDDAVADPMWLSAVAETFKEEPTPALMAGRIFPLWAGSRPSWYPRQREFLLGLYDIGDQPCLLPDGDLPIAANMAGLRDVIVDSGGFDERLGFNYFRKRKRVGGEETILGQRIRNRGHRIVYEPTAVVRHHVSSSKQTRRYFLIRHFWEGVTVVEQLNLMGQIGSGRWSLHRFYGREIFMAVMRFVFPRYGNNYAEPNSVIRMLALSRIGYALGFLYGLNTLRTGPAEITKCASA